MKALTVCQPYAELIARGDKWVENREWPTRYRGPLAIHAGKSRAWLGHDDEDAALYAVDVKTIPFGAVVAIVDLIDCVHIDELSRAASLQIAATVNRRDPAFILAHEHTNGSWCWILDNVLRVDPPIAMNGRQGLWEWRQA